jgi:hypothetical protein
MSVGLGVMPVVHRRVVARVGGMAGSRMDRLGGMAGSRMDRLGGMAGSRKDQPVLETRR